MIILLDDLYWGCNKYKMCSTKTQTNYQSEKTLSHKQEQREMPSDLSHFQSIKWTAVVPIISSEVQFPLNSRIPAVFNSIVCPAGEKEV